MNYWVTGIKKFVESWIILNTFFELYWILTYFSFAVTGCVSIFAFTSLVGIPIGITNFGI